MQKRLKKSIWPSDKPSTVAPEPVSPMEKINQLRKEMPYAGYIRQALLVPTIIPISPATLWRWVKLGQFPKPVRFSGKVTAWRVDDVIAWLMSK